MKPKITVVIPVYNGAEFIAEAIESVLAQTYEHVELFISDNHSTDGTVDIIKKYMDTGKIRLHVQDENVGLIKNGNYCFDHINTEYFMNLSHDDYIYGKDTLKKAADILVSDQDVAVVYGSTFVIDQAGKTIFNRKVKFSGKINSDAVARQSIVSGRNMFGNVILARTKLLDSVRVSSDFYGVSDVQYSTAMGKGKSVYFFEEPMFALRIHQNNTTARDFVNLDDEFLRLADAYDFELAPMERKLVKFNNYKNYLLKRIFYFYLDRLRR